MFRNRAVQVKLVKPGADNNSTTASDILTEETINLIEEAGTRFMTKLGIAVVAVVVAIKIIDTLGQIAIKKTHSA